MTIANWRTINTCKGNFTDLNKLFASFNLTLAWPVVLGHIQLSTTHELPWIAWCRSYLSNARESRCVVN